MSSNALKLILIHNKTTVLKVVERGLPRFPWRTSLRDAETVLNFRTPNKDTEELISLLISNMRTADGLHRATLSFWWMKHADGQMHSMDSMQAGVTLQYNCCRQLAFMLPALRLQQRKQ